MGGEHDLDALLALDGASFEIAAGYVVEFKARRIPVSEQRPHGLSYALVLRRIGGEPCLRFDNAHAVRGKRGAFAANASAFDHWHRSEDDIGRPYEFSTATKLLADFWAEVERVLREKGIPNDL